MSMQAVWAFYGLDITIHADDILKFTHPSF